MNKLTGYRSSHRNRWLFLKNRLLSLQEFLLFEFYLDQMDFDANHDKFGCFEFYVDEIAQFIPRKEDCITSWHKSLIKKGFITLHDKRRSLYKIKNPERYFTNFKGKAAKFCKEEKSCPSLEFFLQNVCFFPEKLEEIQKNKTIQLKKKPSKALSSSKVEFRVNSIGKKKVVIIRQEPRSQEEYRNIHKEGRFSPQFTTDDMEWIDKNIVEKIEVKTANQEQKIVRIFFDGDWEKYKQSLIN